MAEVTSTNEIQANNDRVAKLVELCAQANVEGIGYTSSDGKQYKSILAAAIGENWGSDKTELELLKAEKRKANVGEILSGLSKGPAIHTVNRELDAKVIEAALCLQRGLPGLEKAYGEQTVEAADRYYRHFGVQQLLIQAAMENGYICRPGERIHAGNFGTILKYCNPPIHAAPSSISTSGILSNVANKDLLFGYQQEDQSWRKIAGVKPVNDFKQAKSYRLLDNLEYEELGPTGEIKHGTASEEYYTRQAKTYAKMFVLTRTDVINDDLGAFDDVRNRLGRGSAKKFVDLFWTNVLNNSSFFTSSRANYAEGSGTALGTDGAALEAAVLLFRQLRSPSGDGSKRISGEPTMLMVPPELEFVARKLYKSTNVIAGGGSTGVVMDANIHEGLYEPIIVPWLSDTGIAHSSAKAWYLLRSLNAGLPIVVASFLFGNQSPTVESSETEFNTLGIQFRGYHDFGIDLAEYLGGVKIKGEA